MLGLEPSKKGELFCHGEVFFSLACPVGVEHRTGVECGAIPLGTRPLMGDPCIFSKRPNTK